ncbi:MAG: S8 family peptidase [Williamsia sp.]|nr:S8 family peptidase [Williamsia sp.]
MKKTVQSTASKDAVSVHAETACSQSPALLGVKSPFFVLLLAILQITGFAQTGPAATKIDPVFRFMLDQARSRVLIPMEELPPRLRIEPTRGFATRGGQLEERYECIVYTQKPQALLDSHVVVHSVLPGFVTAWATPEQIVQMAGMPEVRFIEAPKPNYTSNDVAVGGSGAALLHQGMLNNTVYKGKNVIVAIYDTGIDWDHFDFRDPVDTTKSRILRLWDQTLTATTGEAPPTGFSYGVEYTQTQINNELDGTPAGFVRENDINGHGTHVAGTAAGNGAALPSRRYTGMAPEADIVIIKGSNTTFNENRMIDALTYLNNLATALGRPAVMNWSIGSQFGPHDGTRPYERAIDNFTSSAPGRIVAVSAGNDNGTNLHNRLALNANASGTTSFLVSDSTASDVFQYRIYANDSSNITATVTAPDGSVVTANARQSVSVRVLSDSFTVNLANQIDAANSNRYVDVYLTRTGTNTRRPTGTWVLSITNNTTNALTLDGWLYYKNTAFSATTLVGGNSDYMVSSPANASSAIAVASYIGKNHWYSNITNLGYTYSPSIRQDSISTFSSRGPRRDGVLKPEIAATGQAVISCLSSNAIANFATSRQAEAGLYAVDQGTSMASPGVAGGAALLLQANPAATAAQIKSLLMSSANKDAFTELTGATPNATWGAGRMDVFKAASLLFGCGPADRRTIKYDSSTNSTAEEGGTTYTTQRLAVRFTPDITGKLGGVFFHTSLTSTSLTAEVRTNTGGVPGTLLGTLNIDSGKISRYAFNYVDLTGLNIPVSSGTDYFIVLFRSPAATANWSLRSEIISVDGRSLQSTNNGTTWSTLTSDLKIRSVVYNNAQSNGTIATSNSSNTRNINTSNQFINSNCQLINQLVPAGTNAVAGTVTGKVWIEGAVPHYNSKPYVQRHYDVSSADAGVSGRVTLYFTQTEFTAFNADPASTLDLPSTSSDANGISHLRIGKYGGSSSDGSGLIGTYSGAGSVIDPADTAIVFNTSANRWEVTFVDTGFGGYFVQTELYVLPLVEQYFRGNIQGSKNLLQWKISCTTSTSLVIERSENGTDFSAIGSIAATQYDCSQPFVFTDALPLQGNNFYRIRIVQPGGNTTYTSTILLQNGKPLQAKLFPTLIHAGSSVQVSFSDARGYLYITDAAGKQMLKRTLAAGVQSIDLGKLSKGVYLYSIKTDQTTLVTGKIVVQ